MKNRDYPIILGHRFRKGILVYRPRNEDGYRLLICRLKQDYPAGEAFALDDVSSVESEIWIDNRETMQTIVNVLNQVLEGAETE